MGYDACSLIQYAFSWKDREHFLNTFWLYSTTNKENTPVKTNANHCSSEVEVETVQTPEQELLTPKRPLACLGHSFSKISPTTHQTKITDFKLSKQTQNRINRKLAIFIATSMQPYALVENEEFQEFVMSLNPSYCLPGRKSTWTDSTGIYLTKIWELIEYASS